MSHLVDHIQKHHMQGDNTLHVIGVISNASRWNSRYRLFREWRDRMLKTPNVKLHVVEGVYGDHHPECAPGPGQDYNHHVVYLKTEIWLKENMINIAEKMLLPRNWRYLCWEDCDVEHDHEDWALKTIRQLQTFNVVQTWSHGVSRDAQGGILSTDKSFGFLNTNGHKMSKGHHEKHLGYDYAHTGFSWACTRYWWENVRGLLDFCIIGSADHHMAWCCLGMGKKTVHGSMSKGYFDSVLDWQIRAYRACGGRVGYVHGILYHYFHGPRRARRYVERWDIPVKLGFDPKKHIAYDGQGVLYLIGDVAHEINNHLIDYNRSRLEDSNESV